MSAHKTNHNQKEASFWGRFLNFLKVNKVVLLVAVLFLILGAGGVYAVNQSYRQQISNETPSTTSSPSETREQAAENTLAPTSTKTKAPLKTEVADEPSDSQKVINPESTPAPTQTPVCDELQKQVYWDEYSVGVNEATTEARRLADEVFAKKDYENQQTELSIIEQNLIAKTELLYGQYLVHLRSINCY